MFVTNNKLSLLSDKLIEEIKKRKNPFETYTIIVPNLILEQWFKTYWLQKENSVLMNIQFKRLRPFLSSIYNDPDRKIISYDELSIFILKELLDNAQEYPILGKYVTKNGSIDSINLYDITKNLAKTIFNYEKDAFAVTGEQKKLIDKVKAKYSDYAFLSDVIENDISIKTKVFVFGFRKIDPLYLHALEKLDCTIYLQTVGKDKKMHNIHSCASIEREIEYVHGEICKLLKNKNEKVYNITIYAPDLREYEATIKKVFSTADNKDYPEVPYIIQNSSSDSSNSSLVIETLYKILYMDQMTRNDLICLLSNRNVQKARGIDKSKINTIIDALDQMNVYRDNSVCNEWDYGIKRMLAAKLLGDSFNIENQVNVGDEVLLPYGNIMLDDETILVIVSAVEDIEMFRNRFKNKKVYNKDDLLDLKLELNKWLFYSESDPNFYYNAALEAIDNMIDNDIETPFEIVYLSMIDASKKISVNPSNMFTGGITFLNFQEDNIVSSKYMFLIGMSNNNLPRKNVDDELDERELVEPNFHIDQEVYKMLINNSDNVFVSYVNMDLETLEDYQPSSLLNYDKNSLISLGLLENRKYSELFTKREIDKKDYNENLVSPIAINSQENLNLPRIELPLSVKYKELSSFIKENLMSKMERLFKEYDDSYEKSVKEYEPIFCDNLTSSNIEKEILLSMIENKSVELSEGQINEITDRFKLTHSYPYSYKEKEINDLYNQAKKYYIGLGDSLLLGSPFEIEIHQNMDSNSNAWKLVVNSKFIISQNEDKITFNYARVKEIKKEVDGIDLYIISLAYIAKYADSKEYTIYLGNKYSYSINKQQAINILNSLYLGLFNFDDVKIKSLDVFDKNSFDELITAMVNGVWKYFDDIKLINPKENAGYDKKDYDSLNSNISELRKEICDFYKKNILYVSKEIK